MLSLDFVLQFLFAAFLRFSFAALGLGAPARLLLKAFAHLVFPLLLLPSPRAGLFAFLLHSVQLSLLHFLEHLLLTLLEFLQLLL